MLFFGGFDLNNRMTFFANSILLTRFIDPVTNSGGLFTVGAN